MNASDQRPETRPSPPPAARRGLVPERWHAVVDENGIRIEVRVAGMDAAVATVLAATLRGTVDIHSVLSDDEPA